MVDMTQSGCMHMAQGILCTVIRELHTFLIYPTYQPHEVTDIFIKIFQGPELLRNLPNITELVNQEHPKVNTKNILFQKNKQNSWAITESDYVSSQDHGKWISTNSSYFSDLFLLCQIFTTVPQTKRGGVSFPSQEFSSSCLELFQN